MTSKNFYYLATQDIIRDFFDLLFVFVFIIIGKLLNCSEVYYIMLVIFIGLLVRTILFIISSKNTILSICNDKI